MKTFKQFVELLENSDLKSIDFQDPTSLGVGLDAVMEGGMQRSDIKEYCYKIVRVLNKSLNSKIETIVKSGKYHRYSSEYKALWDLHLAVDTTASQWGHFGGTIEYIDKNKDMEKVRSRLASCIRWAQTVIKQSSSMDIPVAKELVAYMEATIKAAKLMYRAIQTNSIDGDHVEDPLYSNKPLV